MLSIIRSSEGFTLVELMLVIVILGVLSSAAIPRFVSVKSGAQEAACRQNLKSMATIEHMYFAENNSYTANVSELNTYLTNASVLQCPAAHSNYTVSSDGSFYSVICPFSTSHGSVSDGVPNW